jgi:hypothetical protein
MENKIEVGSTVAYKSKKTDHTGKVIKIYEQNDKTYYKIKNEKKYHFKQLKSISLVNQ